MNPGEAIFLNFRLGIRYFLFRQVDQKCSRFFGYFKTFDIGYFLDG